MPRYTYKCLECEVVSVVSHRASERLNDCDACGSLGTLRKVPSVIKIDKQPESSIMAPGGLVKEHIEDTKEEISLLKEKLKGSMFENE